MRAEAARQPSSMFKPRPAPVSAPPEGPPSIDVVRKRAKYRLLGVSALVLAGVVIFPILFDTQPRPIPVDLPINIPSRQHAEPLSVDVAPPDDKTTAVEGQAAKADTEVLVSGSAKALEPQSAVESAARLPTAVVPVVPKAPSLPAARPAHEVKPAEVKKPPEPPSKPVKSVAPALPAPSAPKPVPAPEPVHEAPGAKAKEAARVQALLEGRAVPTATDKPAPSTPGRFIVQVGAFADASRAQQVRMQLERAGLKTYTHVADTPEGKRIRVRLGPFGTRAEADKAAAKAKAVGLPAAILTL